MHDGYLDNEKYTLVASTATKPKNKTKKKHIKSSTTGRATLSSLAPKKTLSPKASKLDTNKTNNIKKQEETKKEKLGH